MRRVYEARAREQNRPIDEVKQEYVDQTVLGRMVQTADVVSMVTFLVSSAADNVTGQAIDVAAGWGM